MELEKTDSYFTIQFLQEDQQNGNSISLPSLPIFDTATQSLLFHFQNSTFQPHILPTPLLNNSQKITKVSLSLQNHSFWEQHKWPKRVSFLGWKRWCWWHGWVSQLPVSRIWLCLGHQTILVNLSLHGSLSFSLILHNSHCLSLPFCFFTVIPKFANFLCFTFYVKSMYTYKCVIFESMNG